MKNYSKYLGFVYVISIVLIILTILLLHFTFSVFQLNELKISSNYSDWISFSGSIIGAIISGLITFIAVKLTISHERDIQEDNRRSDVKPYFYYSVLENDEPIAEPNQKIGIQSIMRLEENYDFLITLKIENIGLNSAIDFYAYKFILDGEYSSEYNHAEVIKKDDWRTLVLKIHVPDNLKKDSLGSPKSGYVSMDMFVRYRDLLNNLYSEKIKFEIGYNSYIYENRDGEIENYEYQYKINKVEKAKPILTSKQNLNIQGIRPRSFQVVQRKS